MRGTKLARNNKLMFRVDNMENNDIDSLEVFKPRDSKDCSPLRLYEDHTDDIEEKKGSSIDVRSAVTYILLIVGIVLLIAVGILLFVGFK